MMKRIILYLSSLIFIPLGLTLVFSLFSDKVQFGNGGYNVQSHLLGKTVLIEVNGLYKSLDVEEYILGVLPGTVPADYDIETLKVQAILIRTNVLKEMLEKNTSDAADLSYHYLTVEERKELWGERNVEKNTKKFEQAVSETAGLVVEQEGAMIMALYHEVSIGKTASAKEILDEDISYLQSVESSRDVEAKNYMNLVTYNWQELQELNKQKNENDKADTKEEGTEEKNQEKIDIHIDESTDNGFVKKLTVDGVEYTGDEAMKQFNLTSTNFYVEEIGEGVRFVCLGKGNCLGVSLYGANCMILDGKTAEEVIKYYYQNVTVQSYQANQ